MHSPATVDSVRFKAQLGSNWISLGFLAPGEGLGLVSCLLLAQL